MITYYYIIYAEMVGEKCLELGKDIEIAYSYNALTFQQFVEERIESKDNPTIVHDPHQFWLREIGRGVMQLPDNSTTDDFLDAVEDRHWDGEKLFGQTVRSLISEREIQSVILDEQSKPFVYLDEEFEMWGEYGGREPDIIYEMIAQSLNYINTMIDFILKDSNLFQIWEVACGIIYYHLVSSEYAYLELELDSHFEQEQLRIHPLYDRDELDDMEYAYMVKYRKVFEDIDPIKCFALEYEGILPEWTHHPKVWMQEGPHGRHVVCI